MQANNERPARRATRPRGINLRVGHWITVGLPLLALTAVRPALAADDDKSDAASKDSAADAKDGQDKEGAGAKDEKSEGTAEASATVGTDAAASGSVGGEASGAAASSEGATAAASPASIPAPPGDVARLPGAAFPSEPIRGIEGGSLWMTFHGMQWPVSPFHTDTPRTQLGFSGSGWVDTGYKKVASGIPGAADVKRLITQGRFVLRATPTYTKGDWFVQGQAELVANKDQTVSQPDVADTDDLWLRAGRWNQWDVQVGRFEAWELYHLGMGFDLNTVEREGANDGQNRPPPDFYGVTFAYYRPSGVGNVAFHAYPAKFLRAELLGQIGNQASLNTLAVRPAAILDLGMIKVKGGLEYLKVSGQADDNKTDQEQKGGGGAIQVVLDPRLEFGVNGAYAIVDKIDAQGRVDSEGSITTYSIGGFANARVVGPVLVGVGANYTRVDDLHEEVRMGPPPSTIHGEFSHLQGFGAVQVVVLDQLFIKAVVAYAKADFAPTFTVSEPYQNTAVSARLRLMYSF